AASGFAAFLRCYASCAVLKVVIVLVVLTVLLAFGALPSSNSFDSCETAVCIYTKNKPYIAGLRYVFLRKQIRISLA
ncbi:MAG: hypothetical protein ACRCZQ_05565, partial [Bacteroidales bacterium]